MRPVLLLLLSVCPSSSAFSQTGDTLVVQTFTYGSPQDAWFQFPPDTASYEKVLLYYKLKCNPNQSPACGEWDYLTYTYLYDHTGNYDSTLLSHPSFMVDGASPDSFAYTSDYLYDYSTHWEYNIVYTDTLSWNSGIIGTGQVGSVYPFNAGGGGYQRVQMLWRATELAAAGITAGDLTGMAFDLITPGSQMYGLRIGMKHTVRDSVPDRFEDGFLTVYEHATSFPTNGWQSLPFATPFSWDGTSNILVEVCFDSDMNQSYWVHSDSYPWATMIETDEWDNYLDFDNLDRVDMDPAIFSGIDSFVTIAFWQYGDPAFQPQDQMSLEAVDNTGQRQVNVHLPWSNGRVYWDCGNDGSGYDRIDKAANASDYEGTWNHWAFTKDVASGRMEIFLNGKLWHSGTGKTKTIGDVSKLVLGAAANGGYNYDGYMDELCIWNTVLDSATIRQWMMKNYSTQHPYFSNLVAHFNGEITWANGMLALRDVKNAHHGLMFGIPQVKTIKGCEQYREIRKRNERPQVRFEQGTFLSYLDSVMVIDSVPKPTRQVILFGDSLNPTTGTDTLYVFEAGCNYLYDASGNVIDSVCHHDSTLYKTLNYYYGDPFEVIDRYEIFRYITPYGIGLNLGTQGDGEGFTWIFDVSDFEPLLHDSVHLSAGNWQELLDMKFLFIEGTPPREVKDIRNVYSGGHGYNAAIETNFLTPKKFYIPHNVASARLRINNTGHGFGGNLNCSEFCPRDNNVFINGSLAFLEYLWRDDCDLNPVFPQGGTWIYDRANWCPGAEVNPSIFELTPHIVPGDSITIDYNMQAGYVWNGQGSSPYYQVESQLVTYGVNSFNLDARVEDIIAPNRYEGFKRWNPRCHNPVIRIRNTGTQDLTSLHIEYGPVGGNISSYDWTGNLKFMEETIVSLPSADWGAWSPPNRFQVTVSAPNGGQDEYAQNNSMSVPFVSTPEYPNHFYIQFQTNNAGYENSYKLFDASGAVVYQRTAMNNNTTYRDTLLLGTGCYRLEIYDSDEDGISFFANSDGSGSIRLREVGGGIFKTFQADFGSLIAQSFTVGYKVGLWEPEPVELFSAYPNPTTGRVHVEYQFPESANAELIVLDAFGREVVREFTRSSQGTLDIDLGLHARGLYYVMLRRDAATQVLKVIRL